MCLDTMSLRGPRTSLTAARNCSGCGPSAAERPQPAIHHAPRWRPGQSLHGGVYRAGWKRRSRRLLVTTNTELKAMAAPAISGDSKPRAASGIAATL